MQLKDLKPYLKYLFLVPLLALAMSSLFSVRTVITCSNIFLICSALYLLLAHEPRRPRAYVYAFFIYFIAISASMLWTEDREWGYVLVRRSLLLIGIPAAFYTYTFSCKQWNTIILIFSRLTLLFIVISIVNWIIQSYRLSLSLSDFFLPYKHRISGRECWEILYSWTNYNHPTYIGYALMAALIGCLTLAKQRIVHPAEFIAQSLLCLFVLLIMQSRVGIIMCLTVIVMAVYLFLPDNKVAKGTYWVVVSVAVIAVVYIFLFRHTGFSLDNQRHRLFSDAIEQIRLSPILGVGIGDVPAALNDFVFRNPHNQFLGDWMQAGIPALLAILFLLGCLTFDAIRHRNYALLMFVAVSVLVMLIEMPLNLSKGIATFTTFCCMFAEKTRDSEN